METREKEILVDPYSMFVYAIKSPLTRRKYEGNLIKFFDFTGIRGETISARCALFEQKCKDDPKWVPLAIINFLQSQKLRVERRDNLRNSEKLHEGHQALLRNE